MTLKEKRLMKRQSRYLLSRQYNLSEAVIAMCEEGTLHCVDFPVWIKLASFYGKDALSVPFIVQENDYGMMERYFSSIRKGESVQYSAKTIGDLYDLYNKD